MARPRLEFWFEFASTYSYLSAMRLPGLAQAAGVDVVWRPFLLGPIFNSQGWKTSPFNIYHAKGNYMWRDMARRAARLGLGFHRPDPFPQNSLLAARVAQAAPEGAAKVAFCQNVYLMEFAEAQDISEPDVIAACAGMATGPMPPAVARSAMTSGFCAARCCKPRPATGFSSISNIPSHSARAMRSNSPMAGWSR